MLPALLAYCLFHIALRLWASPNIGTDDVEQALFAQGWSWGYNPAQPPLYTWLLMGLYALVGPGLLAHVVLKYALLGATYLCAWRVARRLVPEPMAGIAAASLLLLAGFAWGVHAGFTHSTLLSALLFATILAAMRAAEAGRIRDYLLFGIAAGLGLISKYSFGLFLVPLLIAMAIEPALRRRLLDWRMAAALVLAALVFLPHGLWMMAQPADYGATLAKVAGIGPGGSYFGNLARGLGSLGMATLVFLFPFWLLAGALLWPALRRRSDGASPWLRCLAWAAIIGLAGMAATAVLFQATYFKDRRMHAVLVTVPVLAVAWAARGDLARWRWRIWLGLLAVCLVGAVVGIVGQALFEARSCRNCRLQAPVPELARMIAERGFQGSGTILAGDEHLGGNLRLAFPAARTLVPQYGPWLPAAQPGQCLLAWSARAQGEELPEAIAAFARTRFGGVPSGAVQAIGLPLRGNASRIEPFRFVIAEHC